MDERPEGLKERMDERFARVDERFNEVGKHLGRVDADIRELRGDVKGMQRLMVQGFFGICTLMLTCFGILAGMIGF